MSISNSAQQTFEERIVAKIKDQTLLAAIGDEDTMTDLVKRALKDALTKKCYVGEGYNRREVSPIEDAARDAMKILVNARIKEVFENEDIQKALDEAIKEVLPLVILESLQNSVFNNLNSLFQRSSVDAMSKMQQILSNSGILVR